VSSPPRICWLQQLYRQYLVEQDVDEFTARIQARYTAATLERLLETAPNMARRAAALALGMVADYDSNQALGEALRDGDPGVRHLSESAIRNVWLRDGEPPQRQQLRTIARLNASGRHRKALLQATELIGSNENIAEAWNQRAIAHFGLTRYTESIHDCRRALTLNSYHFAAQTGIGQCFLRLGNDLWALESFRRALAIYPDLDDVRDHVAALERKLRKKS
jgi:tetratricopeptide (TPR) repeat protein